MGLRTLLALACVFTVALVANGRAASDDDELPRVRAPDFTGADAWLNTDGDKPVSIKDLRGRVVLVDFWTYCCINCMHVFPDLHYLERKYKDQPVVVIGVHSGKFDQEKDADHIRQAVLRHNITHPVAVDSEYKIWNAYTVDAWPTLMLIDPKGYIVAEWSGEGHRDAIDKKIAALLDEGKKAGTLAAPIHFKPERDAFKSGVLEFPGKVLADGAGHRLFISDTNHNRVLVSDLDGAVSQVIGSGQIGLKDGSFAEAQLHQPQGLALSEDGKTLFIADTENHALRAADLDHHTLATLAGNGTQARQIPDDAPAKNTLLTSPWALARVGPQLFIAMAGHHQIWVMDLNKQTISLYAGTGREGNRNGPNLSAFFAQPSGLTTDGRTLYVADAEASTIRAISLTDKVTMNLAGSGDLFGFGRNDSGGRDARFQHPLGVALAGDTLYVADTFNNQIRTIDVKKGTVQTFLGSGESNPGTADAPNFYEPGSLSVSGDTLYIADTNHHRIVAVDIKTKKSRILDVQLPKLETGKPE